MPALIEACGGAPGSSAVARDGASNWDFNPAMPSIGSTEDGGTTAVDGGSTLMLTEGGGDDGGEGGEPPEAGNTHLVAPPSDAGAEGGD